MTDHQVNNTETEVSVHLYTYYRSSCSARLRIALALKKIPYKSTYVNLLANAQRDPEYTAINPSQTVPTLEVKYHDQTIRITQSIAALEYLDEAFPDTYPLFTANSTPEIRATVRTLVSIIASDIQPPTNLRILNRVREGASAAGGDPAVAAQKWARELMTSGLLSYEAVCKEVAGRYSVGDKITMADCCLVPAVWGAERFGVDFEKIPIVKRIYDELRVREEVVGSHWQNQPDTPEELRK